MTVVNHWGKWVSTEVPVTGVVSLNSLSWIDDLVHNSNAINISELDRWAEFKREKIAAMPYNPEIQPAAIVNLRKADQFADCWIIYGVDFLASASDDPTHPQGVWSCDIVGDWSKYNRELGNPVVWGDLPLTLRRYLVEFIDDGKNKSEPTEEQLQEWQEEFSEMDYSEPDSYIVGSWVQDENGLYEPGELTDDNEFSAIVRYDSGVAQVVRSLWVRAGELCSPCYPGQVNLDHAGEFLGYDFPQDVYGDRGQNPENQERWIPHSERVKNG